MADTQTNSWIGPALTSIGSFVTAIMGFVALRFLDARKDERTYEREKAARDDARRDKVREKRNEFQRATLLELQDAAIKYMRNVAKMHMIDRASLRKHGKRFVEPYPDVLDDAVMLTGAAVSVLRVRVLDDEARNLIREITSAASNAMFMSDEQFMRMDTEIAFTFDKFNKRVGVLLRTLDEQ